MHTIKLPHLLDALIIRMTLVGSAQAFFVADNSRKLSIQVLVERGSSAVECRTRNQVSPGSNTPLLAFRRLGIFVLSIDALVDSAV